jgi:hypothetical protein
MLVGTQKGDVFLPGITGVDFLQFSGCLQMCIGKIFKDLPEMGGSHLTRGHS